MSICNEHSNRRYEKDLKVLTKSLQGIIVNIQQILCVNFLGHLNRMDKIVRLKIFLKVSLKEEVNWKRLH
jgi:hypothetical protein